MKPLKALLVEDSRDDAALLLRHLSNEGYDVQSEIVQTSADMKAALADREWDIILSDYTMPHFTGLDALRLLEQSDQDIPIIIISGTIGEDIAVEAMLKGANDYLMKGNLTRLVPAIERDMENAARRRKQKQAEEALRRSEESLANAQRIAHLGNWDWDIQNNQLSWSEEIYRIFGLVRSGFEGTYEAFFETVHPDDRQKVQAAVDATLTQNAVHNYEHRIVRPDGEERIVCEIGEATFDESGKPLRFTGTVQDITERKRAADALENAAKRERAMIENALDVICSIDTEGKFASVSPASLKVWGYRPEELIGRAYIELVAPEDVAKTNEVAAEIMSGVATRDFENCYRHKNGSLVDIRWTAYWSDNEQLMFCIAHDITNRKRLENERIKLMAELDFEKARLQHIFDNSPSFIVALRGPDFVFERVNPAYYKLVGQRNLIGIPVCEALPELADQGFLELLNRVFSTGEPFIGNETQVTLQPSDGRAKEQVYLNFIYTPMREADGAISGVLSYGVDVTEQMLSRIKIQESEERYRLLFDNNPLPMWVFDLETFAFLSVNDAAINHYGYSREEFLTMTVKDIRPPEDVPDFLQNVARDIPRTINSGVRKHIKKDGIVIDVEIITNSLVFNGKKAKLVLANDVTARRKAEESVRFQAHLLNTVEQSVVATDLDGNVIYWNQFAEKLYGWTATEAVGYPVLQLTTPEINQKLGDQTIARLSAGKSWAGEYVVQNKAGVNFPAYTSNSPVHDAAGKVIGFVGISFDITERKDAETALRQAEDKYRRLVESSPAIVYLSEPVPPYSPIYISPNIAKFGYAAEEWFSRPDMWISLIHPEDRDRVLRQSENAFRQGLDTDLEYRLIAADGTIHWLQDRGRFVSDEQGNKTGWQGVMLDITETKVLEEQLRQSQKLESVGLLAGGIAHDFNNMLTAINGYSELTLRKLKADDPLRSNIEEIKKAGERSAALTQQLLAFSRQQVMQPVIINLNEAIADTSKMLDRVIGEDIQLTTTLNSKAGRIKADPGQLSQIITNLAINARDAMPHGGKLTIETDNVFLNSDYARRHVGVLPGAYVMLAVSDNGSGMSDKIKEHIFEPFFTTKKVGHGTGLGLATVYGIVKQSGGSIEVYSEEKLGTTFKIYFPRVADQIIPEKIKAISAELPKGTETILLVEDEDLVRHLSRQILEECGYTIIEARNGVHALEICETGDCKFDLLMTDVVMPQMGGRELAEILRSKQPDIKILFTSGYTDDAVVRHGVIEADTNFIQKPFSPDDLAERIRKILDSI